MTRFMTDVRSSIDVFWRSTFLSLFCSCRRKRCRCWQMSSHVIGNCFSDFAISGFDRRTGRWLTDFAIAEVGGGRVRHICSKFLCPKDLSEFAATMIHRGALSNCPEMKVDLRSLKFPDNSDDFRGSGASIGRSGLLERSLILSGCSSDLEFSVSRWFWLRGKPWIFQDKKSFKFLNERLIFHYNFRQNNK